GFQITLTDNWKDYKTKITEKEAYAFIEFCVFSPDTKMGTEIPGYVCLFSIDITDKTQWDKDAEECKKNPEDVDSGMCDWIEDEISRNDKYVFSTSHAQDFGFEEDIFFQDMETIIGSFQFIEQ
ncbi:MAG: hypothetical protein AAF934_02665, partial [Bacteroidota bacterium]